MLDECHYYVLRLLRLFCLDATLLHMAIVVVAQVSNVCQQCLCLTAVALATLRSARLLLAAVHCRSWWKEFTRASSKRVISQEDQFPGRTCFENDPAMLLGALRSQRISSPNASKVPSISGLVFTVRLVLVMGSSARQRSPPNRMVSFAHNFPLRSSDVPIFPLPFVIVTCPSGTVPAWEPFQNRLPLAASSCHGAAG